MTISKSLPFVLAAAVCLTASTAQAQRRGPSSPGRSTGGQAVPRGSGGGRVVGGAPRTVSPRIVGRVPYRPYYYGRRPGLTIGFYGGYGYPYGYPYRYGYPYAYGYPYGYSSYGYPYGGYDYPLPPAGYVSAAPGVAYGGVRIQGVPEDAQVFADGYYMGVVDDFDGAFKHLNLQAGAHRIEIRLDGYAPVAFDVNVLPGQTITYHADQR